MKNLKIKQLIILSISSLIFVFIFIGLLSVFYSSSISNQTKILYEKPHTNLVNMLKVKIKLLETSRELKICFTDHTTIKDNILQNIIDVPNLLENINSNRVDIKSEPDDSMKFLLENSQSWSKSAKELVEKSKNSDYTPEVAAQYKDYLLLENDLMNKLDEIIETASNNAILFKDKAMKSSVNSITILIIIFIISVLFSLIVLKLILKSIFEPLKLILDSADEIANGNLNHNINYHSNNEFGILSDKFRIMQRNLKNIITDVDKNLYEMGEGNFSINISTQYPGDFQSITSSMEKIRIALTSIIKDIDTSAYQVSMGSDNLSTGAQNLSIGVTEQSNSISNLAIKVEEILSQININTNLSLQANEKVIQTSVELKNSNKQMQEMMNAMDDISNKSDEIKKIIKTIDDIAFQTNILSLNAAVEAARAGETGKGFAVVADEVRNLAAKSSEAAQNTSLLIDGTLQAIKIGFNMAIETTSSLSSVVEAEKEVSTIVQKISDSSKLQSIHADNINKDIDNISNVVKINSSSAENSAAASEELNAQAHLLKEMVKKFRF